MMELFGGVVKVLEQFSTIKLTIPATEMGLYIILITLFMLIRRYNLCIVTTYLFTFYWGFFLYWKEFVTSLGRYPTAEAVYVLSGVVFLVLILIAFFREN